MSGKVHNMIEIRLLSNCPTLLIQCGPIGNFSHLKNKNKESRRGKQ